MSFLACLFQRKSQAVVIARSLLLATLCKTFKVAHYSKSIKGINIKLGILAHLDKVQLQGKGHNSESENFGVMPPFPLSRTMAPDRLAKWYRMWCSCFTKRQVEADFRS